MNLLVSSLEGWQKKLLTKSFEFSQEKDFIQTKKTVEAVNNNGLASSNNYIILSPNCYKKLEVHDPNTDINNTDYDREAVANLRPKISLIEIIRIKFVDRNRL